jgi:hypothetical protein
MKGFIRERQCMGFENTHTEKYKKGLKQNNETNFTRKKRLPKN